MSLRFLPNLLCVLRMLLVYPTALGILEGRYEVVLALFLLTGATKTLPVTIYQYLESGILPTVPAVASMLVLPAAAPAAPAAE